MDSLQPPLSLSSIWWWLGGLCIAIIIAVLVLLYFLTRNPKEKLVAKPQPPDLPAIRRKYLGLLNELVRQYNESHISERAAHSDLSAVVRAFAYEATGFVTQNMTLYEIEGTPYKELAEIIRYCYPVEFAVDSDRRRFSDSLARAKEVVASWK